jgi:hypothetical protein
MSLYSSSIPFTNRFHSDMIFIIGDLDQKGRGRCVFNELAYEPHGTLLMKEK